MALLRAAQAMFAISLFGCRQAATGVASSISSGPAARPSTVASNARFADQTDGAGLSFVQSHAGCGLVYFIEQMASGACVVDANGDGFPDLYFPQPKPIGACVGKVKGDFRQHLFINDRRGHFDLAPNAFHGVETDYGMAAAAGDYDNDGHQDLYVCCAGKNKLFHNRGDGTFEDVTDRAGVGVTGFSTGAVWFDYDNDGKMDLYVLRYAKWSVDIDQPCYTSTHERDTCKPTTYPAATNVLFHNNGDGTFTDVTKKAGAAPALRRSLSAAAVDLDNDGYLDLFVANDLAQNYLLHNNRNGTFTDVSMEQNTAFGLTGVAQANMGIAVGDYNGSGRMSIAITTFANEPFTLYRNDGDYFTDVSGTTGISQATMPFLGFGTCFLDARNLGTLDLFFANGHVSRYSERDNPQWKWRERNLLLLNDGTGRFADAPDALPKQDIKVHRGTCFLDYNNDGKMDLLVTAANDRPTLLRNETAGGNWLLVKLTNKYGCDTPVGAKCIATIAGRKLTRAVLGGGGYGGNSDYRVHFGLGKAESVGRLEIHWLGGGVQVLDNVKANQVLSVRQTP